MLLFSVLLTEKRKGRLLVKTRLSKEMNDTDITDAGIA